MKNMPVLIDTCDYPFGFSAFFINFGAGILVIPAIYAVARQTIRSRDGGFSVSRR